jgi:uncharacterized membrane protein
MHALYTASVFVHIVAACVWIGSMVFFAAVVVPVVRRPEYASAFGDLVRRIGGRFRTLGWTCVVILIATGIANLALRGIGVAEITTAVFWRSDFGRTLAYKLTFVLLTVLATAAHDILFGKRAMRRVARDPASDAARRSRRVASWLGRSTLLFSIAALLCAVWLVRGMP